MIETACAGLTRSGIPCRAKPGASGYCPMHDPVKSAEREQEKQAREAALHASQRKHKPLQDVLAVMKATCKRKGWKMVVQHTDKEAGQYATVAVERSYYTKYIYDGQTVTAFIEVTCSPDRGVRVALQTTSSYNYGVEDLMDAINVDLEHTLAWLGKRVEPGVQGPSNDALHKLTFLLKRFHRIAHQLTRRHGARPTLVIQDEYDVQDLLHAQLLALFDDVRPEDPVPTHAGKASRVDFLLKQEKMIVEVKMTRKNLGDAEVAEQLFIDIKRYQARTDYHTLVCFVYDPGHYLKNPTALEKDLSRTHDQLMVKVIVYSP